MHAFLLTSESQLPPIENNAQPYLLEIRPKLSISIDDIRNAVHFLSRKTPPHISNILVVYEAEKMTLPAQNAFLKTLEEPPGNSLIYLITQTPDQLLPTILSRVQNPQTLKIDFQPDTKLVELAKKFLDSSQTDKFALLENQDFDRTQALEFLSVLEFVLHQKPQDYAEKFNYEIIFEAKKLLKSNVSLRACLDWLCF